MSRDQRDEVEARPPSVRSPRSRRSGRGERELAAIGAGDIFAGLRLYLRKAVSAESCSPRRRARGGRSVPKVALQNDALALAPGEALVGEMLGPRIHRLAHLAAEAAHGERHGVALDQSVIEPGRAGRGDLALEIEVGSVGKDDGGPGTTRPTEAADFDDAADGRRVLERLDAAQPDMMARPSVPSTTA